MTWCDWSSAMWIERLVSHRCCICASHSSGLVLWGRRVAVLRFFLAPVSYLRVGSARNNFSWSRRECCLPGSSCLLSCWWLWGDWTTGGTRRTVHPWASSRITCPQTGGPTAYWPTLLWWWCWSHLPRLDRILSYSIWSWVVDRSWRPSPGLSNPCRLADLVCQGVHWILHFGIWWSLFRAYGWPLRRP